MHESIAPLLAEIGVEADYQPQIMAEEIRARIGQYEGLIIRSRQVDEALLARADRLQFIGRAGAGLDNIDVAAAAARGVAVLTASEGNRDAVAEHAVGMLLTLLNRIHTADREVREGAWRREANRGVELSQRVIGIIGYGYMGHAFARRLSGFGCRVLAYDKYAGVLDPTFAEAVSAAELYEKADVVSLHLPLTEETRHYADAAFFARFRRPIWLLNTARGEIVRLADLADALEAGVVRGAALDVLENEKRSALTPSQQQEWERLRHRPDVLFTPHVAGWTHESYQKINQVLVAKIRRLLTQIPV